MKINTLWSICCVFTQHSLALPPTRLDQISMQVTQQATHSKWYHIYLRHNWTLFPEWPASILLRRRAAEVSSWQWKRINLRIIVEHSTAKGWFKLLPVLLISISAVAMLLSAVPTEIGGTSMVQVLLGVNSLVSLDNQYLGVVTVMGQSRLLAYAISGLWFWLLL